MGVENVGSPAADSAAPSSPERVESGIPRLDYILKGGFLKGSTYMLLGPPGSGKTILGNQFCFNHVEHTDGRCVYLSLLVESHAKMLRHLAPMKFFKAEYIPERVYYVSGYTALREGGPDALLKLMRETLKERQATLFVVDGMESLRQFAEGEQHIKEFVHELQALQLLEKIREEREPRRRLFIDGIEGFRAASVYPDRMPRFLSAFCNQLRTYDVTALVSEELGLFRPDIDMPNPELANVVETVIMLRYVELRSQLYRLLSIMKMRESRYDTSIREFKITDDGLDVSTSFESAEAILTGHARATSSGDRGGKEAHP